ncbi:MAG: response regulator transcription factor [Clostridia bacterium]|nr:response regulator transcription factor [Clostridia bacterium]
MAKILIVEDDEKLRNELEIFLMKNGYEVGSLSKFDNTVKDILKISPSLILLDINLPFLDGEFVLKEIRKVSDVPIIMVTSRENEIDELLSLNYGADDYVTKPFNIQILLAKIATVLKRVNKGDISYNKIDCGNFTLNISKSVIEKDDKVIDLTKNELKILHFLVQKRGHIVSRDEIMEYLWDSSNFIDDNTLTVNVTRLRNKLEDINLKDIIETKRGQGYILK